MAEIPDSKADLISELSGDTNILSPQFCLKYPSAKTLFFVSGSDEFFGRFGTHFDDGILKKRSKESI